MGRGILYVVSATALGGAAVVGFSCNREATYERDVAPIVATSCAGCHRDGGAAFALGSYSDARSHGAAMNDMVSKQQMPPWPPSSDGDCPTFVGDRHLSEDAIAAIDSWVSNGMPKGQESSTAMARQATQQTAGAREFGQLDGISKELGPDAPYQPSAAGDDYRCFVLDPELDKDQFMTAYRMTAGPGIHHVQLWELSDNAGTAQIVAADAAAEGPGFPCTDWPGAPVRVLTVWGPSDPVRIHPAGTGMRIHAGKKLILQVHFHHAEGPSKPSIGLVLADSVAEEATLLGMAPPYFVLPPRTPKTSVEGSMTLPHDAKLWGVRAHMHTLGSETRITRLGASGSSCLLSIPHWDANWQLMYFYKQPIHMSAGDVLDVECSYDTRTRNEEVLNGPTGDDEMCNGYFYVTGMADPSSTDPDSGAPTGQ